jgi:metal-dependent amidase/aminoacylase/carboxypeptidase family protein
VNDPHLAGLARAAIDDAFGGVVTDFPPMMEADDFAFYQSVVPACLIWIGAALQPAREPHTATFDIDERALPRGAAALAVCAMAALRNRAA